MWRQPGIWNSDLGYTPGSGTVVPVTTNTGAVINSMVCGTTYDVYVQADCGGSGPSTWVGPIAVTTGLCPCTTPAPGNTIASAATVCPTETLVLSLQNATPGFGVTYQWYASPDGVTYSPVGTGAATYSTTQSAATYYYCDVTCARSINSSLYTSHGWNECSYIVLLYSNVLKWYRIWRFCSIS
ncbi:MAG: hypothetical protein HWD58_04570 [Bacteroidota bacterium]|nr:MAG: hypothetical protein HWD58_04570 [Bacteroidota bacterium]